MNSFKNFNELQEQRPQIVKRLVNWGLVRKNKWGFKTLEEFEKQKREVNAEIGLYLDDLVFTPTKFSQAKDNLIYWGGKLSNKEKETIGLLIPYELPQPRHNGKEFIHTEDSNLSANWYDGLYKVLDEPVLDKISYNSEDLGMVTENSYGAVVLNTDNMMIIDIDVYSDCSKVKTALYPEQAIASLSVLEEKQGLSFRIYETSGGLRAIEVSKEWNPKAWDTIKIMKSVYADPLYVGLCQSQECFRARLTPKPWRLGGYIDWDDFINGEQWMRGNAEDSEVAVCKLLSGQNKPIDSKFKSAIEYHDNVTKALICEGKDLGLV